MARLPAFPTLPALLTLALVLSACGSPEPTPDPAAAQDAAAPAVADQTPVMPDDAPPQEEAPLAEGELTEAAAPACRDALGEAASARLVERCIAVSPATRPPCNAANPCALIQNEIDRSCAGFGADRPEACEA